MNAVPPIDALLARHDLILIEAAVVERLRRGQGLELHETLVHAPLIYDEAGRGALASYYREYLRIAHRAGLPLLTCTPTWRANRERVEASGVSDSVNEDATRFMQDLREEGDGHTPVLVGGLIGCKNDCYRPAEGLAEEESRTFHRWQIERLVSARCDYLMAATLPALPEAVGIARAMAAAGVPYAISFVIGRDGRMLDGNDLATAIARIDQRVDPQPFGFFVNCAHPSFLHPENLDSETLARLVGFQANASSLDHTELDGSAELQIDHLGEWAEEMIRLNRQFGVKILGGCCGTSGLHLDAIVRTAG